MRFGRSNLIGALEISAIALSLFLYEQVSAQQSYPYPYQLQPQNQAPQPQQQPRQYAESQQNQPRNSTNEPQYVARAATQGSIYPNYSQYTYEQLSQRGEQVPPAPRPLPMTQAAPQAPAPQYSQQPFPPQEAPEANAGLETLDEAWGIALHADQRYEASRWNVSSSRSSYAAAKAERLPSVNLGANAYSLSEEPTMNVTMPALGAMQLPLADQNSGGASALVTQPIYTFGRISSGIDAAAAAVQANQCDAYRTNLDVKMSVAELYVAVLRAARLVEVAQSKSASLTSHNRVVGDMFEKGVVSKNDYLAAQVALADAQQQLLEAQNGLEVVRAAYNRALGRPLTTPVRLADITDDGATGDVDQLTSRAMQQRPEISALSSQAIALRRQADSVKAKKLPQIGVTGGYIYEGNKYMDPNGYGVMMLNAQWNVVDFGRVSNQADALREKAEGVIRTRQDAESLIALEVRQKWLDLHTARERALVAKQATAQADENLRVAQDRYQQQVGTNTEALDAETLRVQAYTNFYNSSYQAILAGLRLRRAVGDL